MYIELDELEKPPSINPLITQKNETLKTLRKNKTLQDKSKIYKSSE